MNGLLSFFDDLFRLVCDSSFELGVQDNILRVLNGLKEQYVSVWNDCVCDEKE